MNKKNNILIVFYSYSGNTREIAKEIQKQTNADVFEIQTVEPYPEDYNSVVELAKKEKNNNFKPALKNKVENLQKYDIICMGTPVWWYTMAPPVKTFIDENNLEGKIILPFCTHGGGGESSTFTDMQKLIPNAKFLKGISIYERGSLATHKEIEHWLEQIK